MATAAMVLQIALKSPAALHFSEHLPIFKEQHEFATGALFYTPYLMQQVLIFRANSRFRLRLCQGLTGVLLATNAASATPDSGFTRRVTEGLINFMSTRFGGEVRPRLNGWVDFAKAEARRVLERNFTADLQGLQRVNSQINRVPYKEDRAHWREEDYWATPAETVASHGGDCEDYAIAKYFLLKELGVPLARLRMVYVRAGQEGQAHMVLAYYESPNADPLILDNLNDRVLAASMRRDLAPVYLFNEDDVVLIASNQRTTPQQIRAWRALMDRLNRESSL